MTALPLSRLTLLGFLLALPALYFALRFTAGFLRMLTRKFRKGHAYLQGSATDYLSFALASWTVALAGTALLAAAVLQGGLQTYQGTREVGTVRAETLEPGRLHISLDLGETHPGHGKIEADLPGARWALEGEFLRWSAAPRWLGFESGHRVESVLGSGHDSGPPEREADSRTLVAGVYGPWFLAHRHPRWAPLARTALRRTPWLKADGGLFKLFVTDQGYVLREQAESPAGDADPASMEEGSGNR